MNHLHPTTQFELGSSHRNQFIYESFYFRGNSISGNTSFWLKHNLLRFTDSSDIRVDQTIILFDDDLRQSQAYSQSTHLTEQEYADLRESSSWRNIRIEFETGGYFELAPSGDLRGAIGDQVRWELRAKFSGTPYFHFSEGWGYRLGFPKKKILTVDCWTRFEGQIESPFQKSSGIFFGMNGHNWGTEHAHRYGYTNCNEFTQDGLNAEEAYLDCFSAKILVAGFQSPYLSAGSLFFRGRWYHFNRLVRSWTPQVQRLDSHTYHVTFENTEHRLEVDVQGTECGWSTLAYDHPSRQVSVVRNAKRASGTVTLTRKEDRKILARLYSKRFELEMGTPAGSSKVQKNDAI